MKKVFLFAFLFLSIASINAQNKLIKERFIKMQQALLDKEFEKSLEFTAEELFEIVPKEQLVSVMEATFNNPKMQIDSDLPKVLDISDVFQVKNKFYAILKITGNQRIRVLGDDNKALGLDDRLLYALKLNFEQQYGSENVKFDEKTKFFNVIVNQTIVSISYDGETDWKYLAIDNLKLEIISKLLPQEVLNKVIEND
ncbi:hypothetical protein [Polaribacter sp. MED152]|uniref:hypothetical protein n=1 Tax=Polaribacter sp. MED152 TaxID=313598 RepID=UPI000068C9FB|nr:hypothetical protein [Polaribacter sp. MED152]EAQ41772.1 hypothetical protein MED152_03620 [Polaribacter sp. MED152]